jgi:hypothetical protein
MTYKSKASLLSRLHEVVLLLNGEFKGGKRATFSSDFKTARYAFVLLAAVMTEIFSEHTIREAGEIYCNLYKLDKIAKRLNLIFDRTRIANKIFERLENEVEVRRLIKDNKTFITFTEVGKRKCLRKLEELCELNKYFYMNSAFRDKYTFDSMGKDKTKGVIFNLTEEGIKVDNLIKTIGSWD